MPKGSRSNRRQPAFDPSELEDLIFTPAVGTGVGSHLIDRAIHFPAPTSGLSPAGDDLSSFAQSLIPGAHANRPTPDSNGSAVRKPTTVVMSTTATVDRSPTVDISRVTTVDREDATTVDDDHVSTGPESSSGYDLESPVDETDMTTVVLSDRSTVVPLRVSTVDETPETTVDTSHNLKDIDKANGMTRLDMNSSTTVDELNMATVARFDQASPTKLHCLRSLCRPMSNSQV